MRIAMEASAVANPRPAGIARFVRRLSLALSRHDDIEVELWYRLSRWHARRHWWRPSTIAVRSWQGRFWPLRAGVDVLHGPDALVPPRATVPSVITLHDLAVLRLRDRSVASSRFRERKLARYRTALHSAGRIICVSRATAADAVELLGADKDRLRVVHHGVEARFQPLRDEELLPALNRYGLRPGYLLYVGTVSERKNTERLVHAYHRSRARGELPLVLAGRVYHRSQPTLNAVRELGLEDRVRCLGYIRDADLPALYGGARALLLPSLYEGFGLPVLEALACGVPVLCADRGGAPEVGGRFAVPVDAEDTDAVAAGIDAVVRDPPASAEQRRAHAADFTWERAARQTVAVYRELLDGP